MQYHPPLGLVSGVPQGGILSLIIFTLYTADMELWLKTSKLFNFADDTTTYNKGKSLLEINFLTPILSKPNISNNWGTIKDPKVVIDYLV